MTTSIISQPGDPRKEVYRPTSTVIVEYNDGKKDGVVIVERKNWPWGWCFPGGFLEYGEKLHACGKREIEEETNLQITLYSNTPLVVQSDPERDPRKFFGYVIDNMYIGLGTGVLKAGDDARNTKILTPSELERHISTEGMPFDHADSAMRYLKRRKSLEEQLKCYDKGIVPKTLPTYAFASQLELDTYKQRLGITKDMELEQRYAA